MSHRGARRQMTGQLELPLRPRGETSKAERSDEAPETTRDSKRSGASSLMEAVLDRDNLKAALKRVNREIARLRKFEARKELGESARRALALRRAQQFSGPTNEPTSREGMKAIPNRRRNIKLPRSTIGRVSQANKRAQAQRDSRR